MLGEPQQKLADDSSLLSGQQFAHLTADYLDLKPHDRGVGRTKWLTNVRTVLGGRVITFHVAMICPVVRHARSPRIGGGLRPAASPHTPQSAPGL